MAPIKPEDPRAPYVQIADDIRQAIENGELRPGQKLDSGPTIAERYDVAPMTVQRAVQRLKADKLVVSWQGRGIFVADPVPDMQQPPAGLTERVARLEQRADNTEERLAELDERTRRVDG